MLAQCVVFTALCRLESVSARALVKKTQKPGIKLQKADFFQELYLGISPDECRSVSKNPPCAFFKFKMAATM